MSIAAPDLILGDRYQCLELLRAHRGMVTSLGQDLRDGAEVVLKVVHPSLVSSGARQRLEREAAVLRELGAPWLAPILDVGSDADRLWIVQPWIPGVPLSTHLPEGRKLTVDDVLTIARCVLTALVQVHEHGILHGHVRPGRVIVDPQFPITGATLIGCGLARNTLLGTSPGNEPAQTVRYLSPERVGLLDREVDERSDLYAVGIVLYECLAGRAPFTGRTVHEVLLQHVAAPPARLHELNIDVPPGLEDIIHRLLRQDPEERYPAAAAVLVELEDLAGKLDRQAVPSGGVAKIPDSLPRITEPSLVARDAELSALEMFLERARSGAGGLVVLQGESGGGKTRLMDEFARRAGERGAWVLRGQGADRVGQRPLGLLARVVGDVVARAKRDDDLLRRLRRQLGDHAQTIREVLPELGGVLLPGEAGPSGPEDLREGRTLRALAALVEACGTEEHPALLLLDDCQWADELSRALLSAWSEPSRRRHHHVLVIAAFRVDSDEHVLHPLPDIRSETRITLSRLSPDQIGRLVESMAGPLPSDVLDVVARTSDGSPFMAGAILRGLVESGALVPTPAGWQARLTEDHEVRSSRRAASFLARRADLLPPACVRLLSIGAVLGREFDLGLASRLATVPPEAATASIEEARRRHMVWRSESGTSFIFAHDQLRDVFLGRLTTEERRRYHKLAGLELEASGPATPFDLSYHFDAADERDLAFPHALAAAEEARSRYALAIAEQQYRLALRSAPDADLETRLRIAERLADVLALRAHYGEATRLLREALSFTADDLARARLEGKLASLAHKQGDMVGAREPLERALHLLGRPVPRHRVVLAVLIVKEVATQLLHRLRPGRARDRRPAPGREADLLVARLYERLGAVWWHQGGAFRTLWVTLRQLNLAERHGPSHELGQAYATFGVVLTHLAPRLHRRGLSYVGRSLEVRRQLGDPWGEGQALSFHGLVHYVAGEYRAALDSLEEASRLLERIGDPYELHTVVWHVALCRYRLGELHRAETESRRLYYQAAQIGGLSARFAALEIWAKVARRSFPRDVLVRELKNPPEPVHYLARLLQAEAIVELDEGRALLAVDRLERARRLVVATRRRDPYLSPVFVWLASARRRAAEAAPPWSVRERRRLVRRASREARRALRVARSYRNDLPHALREAALLASMRGRVRRARRCLDASIDLARRQGARWEYAESRRLRGEVGMAHGWPGAAEDLAVGERLLALVSARADPREEDQGEKVLGLVDRFETMLDVGRRIASADNDRDIWESVTGASKDLLRAEECAIIEVSPDSAFLEVLAGSVTSACSPEVAREALARGSPVVCPDDVGVTACGKPLDGCGAYSGLYVPMTVQGSPVCLFVAHRRIRGLFGAEEARLAEFIASVASAASERILNEQETLVREIAAREAERTRLSRDLHDEVGQSLTSALLSLRLLHDSLDQDGAQPTEPVERAAQVREILTSTLRQVRGLAFELRPTVLDDLGLVAALRRLTKDLAARHDLVIDLVVEGLDGRRLPTDIETATYRVCQEALANVIRHSGAVYCRVSVRLSDRSLQAVIRDQGRGFDAAGSRDTLGLRGMAERAALVGGSLTVDSSAGCGTTVVLEVPLG